MNKNRVRMGALVLAILAVFQVLAFAIPFAHTAVFWIAYTFTMIAIVALYPLLLYAFSGEGKARISLYGFPVARLAGLYLAVQVVFGLAAMVCALWVPYWIVLILEVLILAAAIIGLIATSTAQEEVERADVQLKTDVSIMHELQSRANALLRIANDPQQAAAVRALAEELRFSDPVSSEETRRLEEQLEICLERLEEALQTGGAVIDVCHQANALLIERNRICMRGKDQR